MLPEGIKNRQNYLVFVEIHDHETGENVSLNFVWSKSIHSLSMHCSETYWDVETCETYQTKSVDLALASNNHHLIIII